MRLRRTVVTTVMLLACGTLGAVTTAPSAGAATAPAPDAVAVAGAESFGCVLRATGRVACRDPLAGRNGAWLPVEVAGVTAATAVAVTFVRQDWPGGRSGERACAVHGGGAVSCWLQPPWNAPPPARFTAVRVGGIDDARSLDLDGYRGCALRATGGLSCWIWDSGQLGPPAASPVPRVSGLVAYGGGCGVRPEGTVHCPPDNPRALAGVGDAVALSGGQRFTCALGRSGTVSCWGWNDHGELGRPTPGYAATALPVPGISDAVALRARDDGACAVRRGGVLTCWGRVPNVGFPADGPGASPRPVPGVDGVRDVALGGVPCVVQTGGRLTCWNLGAPDGSLASMNSIREAGPVTVYAFGGWGGLSTTLSGYRVVTADGRRRGGELDGYGSGAVRVARGVVCLARGTMAGLAGPVTWRLDRALAGATGRTVADFGKAPPGSPDACRAVPTGLSDELYARPDRFALVAMTPAFPGGAARGNLNHTAVEGMALAAPLRPVSPPGAAPVGLLTGRLLASRNLCLTVELVDGTRVGRVSVRRPGDRTPIAELPAVTPEPFASCSFLYPDEADAVRARPGDFEADVWAAGAMGGSPTWRVPLTLAPGWAP